MGGDVAPVVVADADMVEDGVGTVRGVRDAQEQLGVLGVVELFVVAADGNEGLGRDREAARNVGALVDRSGSRPHDVSRAAALAVVDRETDEWGSGAGCDQVGESRDALVMEEVVVIQEEQVPAGCGTGAGVPGVAPPALRAADHQCAPGRLGNGGGVVGGAVVDDDDLDVGAGRDAGNRLADGGCAVV